MRRTVRVVCRPEVAAGFRLAGLHCEVVRGSRDGAARALELASDPTLGVILVEEVFYDAFSDDARRALGRRALPMLVPFPGPDWTGVVEEAEAHLIEILRQAIGYRVRLR